MPQTVTLADLLARAASYPDVGIRFLGRRGEAAFHPWPEIVACSRRISASLRALGMTPGERVALLFPTAPGFLEAFFGAILARLVPVPLYPPSHLGRLDEYHARTASMITAARVSLVLADRRVMRLLGEVVRQAAPARGCFDLEDLARRTSNVDAQATATDPSGPASPDDLAFIQFSSGTTASPKPVALSHRAVVAQTILLNSHWPDTSDIRHSGVSWLPLYHDMGLVGTILTALERPGTVTLIPPELFVARPVTWLRAISDYGATISTAPTFGYGHCVQRIRDEDMEGVDLSRWQVALCGGEAVVPAVLRRFEERFSRWGFSRTALTPVYGLAEATLAVTFSNLETPFVSHRFDRRALEPGSGVRLDDTGVELASLGRPVPGFDVRIAADDDQVLGEGTVGRIECRGPSLMCRYDGLPDATAQVMKGDWLVTGDLGFCHEGELYVVGREKDLLIVRGRNYVPEDIEQAAAAAPDVRPGRCAAVSYLPEARDTEQVLVFVEARRGVPRGRWEEIAEACRVSILAATGLTVERVIVVAPGTLPRTSSGKLRRRELLAQHLAGTLRPPTPVTPLRVAASLVQSWMAFRRNRKG